MLKGTPVQQEAVGGGFIRAWTHITDDMASLEIGLPFIKSAAQRDEVNRVIRKLQEALDLIKPLYAEVAEYLNREPSDANSN